MIRMHGLHKGLNQLRVAGGGALRFKDLFLEQLQIEVVPMDEISALVSGIMFLAEHCPGELYTVGINGEHIQIAPEEVTPRNDDSEGETSPMLLVNMGSGVMTHRKMSKYSRQFSSYF